MILRSMIISVNGYWVHGLILFFLFKNVLMIIAAIYKLISIKFEYDKHLKHLKERNENINIYFNFNFNKENDIVNKTRL